MRVAFLLSAYNPCQHWRMIAPAHALPAERIVFAGCGFTPAVLEMCAGADIVQMSYCCQPREAQAIGALKAMGVKVAVDYDDNLLQAASRPVAAQTVACCALADLVTVTTEELAAAYRAVSQTPVEVVPTRIDTADWHPRFRPQPARLETRICYLGTKTHTRDLASVAPALWNVLRTHQNARLSVFGCEELPVPLNVAARVSWTPWRPLATAHEMIRHEGVDIAIAPLVDVPFNRGRSPLKWLQFAALGIPTVASAIPPYAGVIRDGYDGYLASDLSEWESRLDTLIRYPRIRQAVGDDARRRAVREFDLSLDAPRRLEAYLTAWRAPARTAGSTPANLEKGGCGDTPERPGAESTPRPVFDAAN